MSEQSEATPVLTELGGVRYYDASAALGNIDRVVDRQPWSGAPTGFGVLQCCGGCGCQRANGVLVYVEGQWRPVDQRELNDGVAADVEWFEAHGLHPRDRRWSGQHIDGSVCDCVAEAESLFGFQRHEPALAVDQHPQLDAFAGGLDGDAGGAGAGHDGLRPSLAVEASHDA